MNELSIWRIHTSYSYTSTYYGMSLRPLRQVEVNGVVLASYGYGAGTDGSEDRSARSTYYL